ncbi:hypothetical protein KUTeg_002405 [Tegillarca granosa]|uniref:CIDE-N domain-containing protein n=1 Tax=Tegillarca granosa TaxID=220873 RepID=A0ABQ9FYQ3_TEGGR|nr:hypothetical protein KUTeg_002405 [Tegillarca granosa]
MTFFSRFLSLFNGGMRAYKVQDVKREARIGVTAKNFQELVKKGCEKLKMSPDDITIVIEDDGTISLYSCRKERNGGEATGALIHDALSKLFCATRKNEIACQIRELLEAENAPEKVHIISQYLDMMETSTESEQRYEHEDWFEGLTKKYKCKSEVMRHNAQTRVRSYYTTAKDQIDRECSGEEKELLLELLEDIFEELKRNDFHSSYFDRTAQAKNRICDNKGWFKCEGPFDKPNCEKFHTINPYASRGYRLLFGLWNLDHVIEKSREVIPTVIEAAKNKPKYKNLDKSLLYKLLFTRHNLKLVQVGCHKKAARSSADSANCKWQDFCH